jgi:hypothetical protein
LTSKLDGTNAEVRRVIHAQIHRCLQSRRGV